MKTLVWTSVLLLLPVVAMAQSVTRVSTTETKAQRFSRNNATAEAREELAASIRTRNGKIVAKVSWTVDNSTSEDVLRGRVEYRPDANRGGSCKNIRFVQIAKVERNGGLDYDWQGGEEHRNLIRTSADSEMGVRGGYYLDHQAFACRPGASCSPYFRDYWASPEESHDGFQEGRGSSPASLVDYPFGWTTLERISLESCARCADDGRVLACAEWGARWPAQGAREILPIVVHDVPSRTFVEALRRFNAFYSDSVLTPVQGDATAIVAASR